MEQLEFFDIPSPCIGVCQAGDKGFCLGCYRSREERLYWLQLTPDAKRKVIKACTMRKRRAQQQSSVKNNEQAASQQQLGFGEADR
ncbi:DUF1289 domain-containing protein [Aliiglaciecola sp. CAU 1673]|uniref:DUF1289 domain-containing protein n=1 Tax=Aliiglaciecola sp. CAU 1673 TaxID=3032595 RepID=UPI0023D9C871|nr:DUF1289 domain-containing protein [Aliiglaciecola sp. CAU 1673]MDF2179525.1 DUF1289 domain-containing protein [Aliiglaciecola sp. CAU 1673]